MAVCGLLLLAGHIMAQDAGSFEKKEFVRNGDTLRYRLQYPLHYDAHKKYPLLLFLHGAGERGSDNEAQLKHGGKLLADSSVREKYPAFVIAPQCPANDWWSRIRRDTSVRDSLGGFMYLSGEPAGKALSLVSGLLDSLASSGSVNKQRIYVGGLSMGGMGTYEILWRKPHFFAAAFPICGGGDPEKVKVYAKGFPVWIFHGDKDPVVPPANSRRMVNALKAAGARVKYTEYPGVLHNSWDNAFAEPELFSWLFAQKK